MHFLKRYLIVKKVEKFFSGFLTCWGRKNAFCDSRIRLCLPCVKLRLLLRHGKLPYAFRINTKNGMYYFYYLRKLGSRNLAFYFSNKMLESWKSVIRGEALLKIELQRNGNVPEKCESDWFNKLNVESYSS